MRWLVTLSCGSGGQRGEVGGGSPVDLRSRIGVVPQCRGPTAAMAKARRGDSQVELCREQLASRALPQPLGEVE